MDVPTEVQALIITPTRELAIQITEEAMKLKKAKDINILAAYGGKDISSQQKKLKRNIHLIKTFFLTNVLRRRFSSALRHLLILTAKVLSSLLISAKLIG